MRRVIFAFILSLLLFAPFVKAERVVVGAERTNLYLPMLEGKRVAVMTNQSGTVGDDHLVDVLVNNKVNVVANINSMYIYNNNCNGSDWNYCSNNFKKSKR